MFNFYQAAERREKAIAAEAKRAKEIEDETDTAALRLYQALHDYVSKENLPANVMQYHRTINITKNNGHSLDITVSAGPTFVRQIGGVKGSRSIATEVIDGLPTRSIREVEDAIVEWLSVP